MDYHVDRLRVVEERIQKERDVCARLEEEIRHLTYESALMESAEEVTNPFLPEEREGGGKREEERRAPVPVAPPATAVAPSSAAPPPPPPGSGRKGRRGPKGQGRGESPRQIKYRSPMYRSASPSRRVGADGVRISSFSRAPRFKDERTWVPGPGKYAAETSDFAPRTVQREADLSGLEGHTWADVSRYRDGERGDGASEALVVHPTAREGNRTRTKPKSRLREELDAAYRRMEDLQMELTRSQAHARTELADLRRKIDARNALVDSGRARAQQWRERVQDLEVGVAALSRAVTTASSNGLLQGTAEGVEILAALERVEVVVTAASEFASAPFPPDSKRLERAESDAAAAAAASLSPSSTSGGGGGGRGRGGVSESARVWSTMPEEVRSVVRDGEQRGGETGESTSRAADVGVSASSLTALSARVRERVVRDLNEDTVAEEEAAEREQLRKYFGAGAERPGVMARLEIEPAEPGPKEKERRETLRLSGGKGIGGASTGTSVQRAAPLPVTLRRVTAGESVVNATLEMASPPTEGSVAEKLRHIFEYYGMYGGRLESGEKLKSSQFYRFCRDAKILSPRISPQVVDIVFTKHVARREGAGAGFGARLDYDSFVDALADLALRKFGPRMDDDVGSLDEDGKAEEEAGARESALRTILDRNIFPLYDRLRRRATFVYDVIREGTTDQMGRFNEEFVSKPTLRFFNEYADAFQHLFVRYTRRGVTGPEVSRYSSSTSSPGAFSPSPVAVIPEKKGRRPSAYLGGGGGGGLLGGASSFGGSDRDQSVPEDPTLRAAAERRAAWQAVLESDTAMGRREFYTMASEMKIMGPLLSRHDLTSIFREANRGVAQDDNPDAISYPEFIEMLALVAFHCFRYADAREHGGTGVFPNLVSKVKFLIFSMHEHGAHFVAEETRLVRDVINFVKQRLRDSHVEARAAEDAREERHVRSIASVLSESITK